MQQRAHIPGSQSSIHNVRERFDSLFQQPLKPGTYDIKGKPEYHCHDADKCRNGSILTCEYPVNGPASFMFLAFVRLYHRLMAKLLYEAESHIRDGCRSVQTSFLFHLADDVLQHILFVFRKFKSLQYQRIAFNQFGRCKSGRYASQFCMILNQVHYTVKAPVNCAPVFVFVTEIGSARLFLILSDMQSMSYKLVDTFILCGRNRHHRYAQHVFHFVYMYSSAVAAYLVHHVQRQYHRRVQLHELHGQIKVSFDIGGIHYVDDACRLLVENELSRHYLLAGVG